MRRLARVSRLLGVVDPAHPLFPMAGGEPLDELLRRLFVCEGICEIGGYGNVSGSVWMSTWSPAVTCGGPVLRAEGTMKRPPMEATVVR